MNLVSVIKSVSLMVGSHTAVVKHSNPFRVLISTVISQRTKDETTDRVSRELFKKHPTIKSLRDAPVSSVEKLIYGAGFYKTKARRIKELAGIVSRNGMPKTFNELMKLPGVGRKTANCVLVYGYATPAIPVDVHVHRIMNRLGVVNTNKPEETELALMKLLPRSKWLDINDLFVKFGQKICKPVKPLCENCTLRDSCKYFNNFQH